MLFLEIEHPQLERVVLPLKEGRFLFPPPEFQEITGGRLRLVVEAERVVLEPLDPPPRTSKSGSRSGSSSRRRGTEVGLREARILFPGRSLLINRTRLTLRTGTSITPRRPQNAAPRSPSRELQQELPPATAANTVVAPSGEEAVGAEVIDETTRLLSVHGRDRWILSSLFAASYLGRRDLRRVLTIYRNKQIAGSRPTVSAIMRKDRFLGREFDAILDEVETRWRLACGTCGRVFEPEPSVLANCRCLECDRRLTVRRRGTAELATNQQPAAPRTLVMRYDRLHPGVRLGDYKIDYLLGVGGYGAVYRAFDTRIQRTVALKVFPSSGESGADVFKEARNVAGLPPHPNLVLVFHVGRALGFDFISYEYVSGESLAYHIDRHTKMSVADKLLLLKDVLSGLAVAHEHGIIHRDLKPDNILLVRIEGRFRARLTDFGLGQKLRRGQPAYRSRTVRGAPEYLAPEQFRNQVSSVASDLYSVGATFFHLLAGRPPYRADSDREFAQRHVEDPVPLLGDELPNAPRALEQLFSMFLAKLPKSRPRTAAEALELLARAEAELHQRQARALRRLSWALTAACAALVIGGFTLFSKADWQFWKDQGAAVAFDEEDGAQKAGGPAMASLVGTGSGGASKRDVVSPKNGDTQEKNGERRKLEGAEEDSPESVRAPTRVGPGEEAAAEQIKERGLPDELMSPVAGETHEQEDLATEDPATAGGVETPFSDPLPGPPVGPSAAASPRVDVASQSQSELPQVPADPELENLPEIAHKLVETEAYLDQLEELGLLRPDQLGPEELRAYQRLRVLEDVLGVCVPASRWSGTGPAFFIEQYDRHRRKAMELGMDSKSVAVDFYSVRDVDEFIEGIKERLIEADLFAQIAIRPPNAGEAKLPGIEPPDTYVLVYEWIRSEGRDQYLPLHHLSGDVIRRDTFSRPSTVRLHVTVHNPATLIDRISHSIELLAH